MQSKSNIMSRPVALAIGAAILFSTVSADAATHKGRHAKKAVVKRSYAPPSGVQRPAGQVYLSLGQGQLITLPVPISDVFVANEAVADVRVQSPTQLYLFGKTDGETSVYATTRSGAVAYSTNVRVAQNYNSLDQMLRLAMPDTDVRATLSGQVAVLTGTVKSPDDIQQAGDLTRAYLNPGVNTTDPAAQLKVIVINRLRAATPLQVRLEVRIAEVSRSFSQNFAINFSANNVPPPITGAPRPLLTVNQGGSTTIDNGTIASLSSRLLGLNVLGKLDVGENEGFVTTLASPNLTALSGEKATFLAGGEIPLPFTSTTNGGGQGTSIVFKPYGVTVEFLPTVLSDGRISLIVKPEVSEPDFSRTVGGIPGFRTRRVETTVELGSGQSFVIGGLLSSKNENTMKGLPGAKDVPILGALFKSNAWQRGETELMIVVTPYLVNPVAANKIALPTDGYKAPTSLGRIFMGDLYKGSSEGRPVPTMAPPNTVVRPSVGARNTNTVPAPGFSN